MENFREREAYTVHDLVMKRPASAFCHRWRDATALGTGLTGALLTGGASQEMLILNRYDLWCGGADAPVPDISGYLEGARDLYRQGRYMEANDYMYQALLDHGYSTTLADMRTLGCVTVKFPCLGVYRHYRRVLHMDRAEAEVTFTLEERKIRRRYFASRKRDLLVMEVQTEVPDDLTVTPGFYLSGEGGRETELAQLEEENARFGKTEDGCSYSSVNEGKYHGILCRIVSDGTVTVKDGKTSVACARRTLILIRAFSQKENRAAALEEAARVLEQCPGDYETLLAENLPLYQPLYRSADLSLCTGETLHTNEQLLEDARDEEMSPELAEKLWRFGRYLFISGTAQSGTPFPLYGLWAAGYQQRFTHNVANENVQSLYWFTDTGGLKELVLPLIRYYYERMDTFRENARQVYGCRGIFVGTYTTPVNAAVAWYLPVILHFCGAAGWLSAHFYRYYRYSGDEETLETMILPFMLEAAQFYEDYLYPDEDGTLTMYPAVSPENSPAGYYRPNTTFHLPTAKNPTIEIAILKELLQNLLALSETHPRLREKAEVWQGILERLPQYRINDDGAVAEWIPADLRDAYRHRHLSHLYPVFPGEEYETLPEDMRLAFRRAADLRQNDAFCGWSLPHGAAVYARLGDGDMAFRLLNMLPKCCMLENLFTLGLDYRYMGITNFDCGDEFHADVQLDALLSVGNALQEMLLYSGPEVLRLLPACPAQFGSGHARLHFPTGEITLFWDLEKQECRGRILARRQTKLWLELPFGREKRFLQLQPGEEVHFS